MKDLLKRFFRPNTPELFLHIGLPKTGTSTIQGLLFDNKTALARQDYFYPDATLGGNSDYAYAHHTLAHAILENDDTPWLTLQSELARNKNKKIIISSEAFSNCRDPMQFERLHNLLSQYKIKIIVYIRRQDEFLQGLYQTLVTYSDLTSPFNDYFELMLNKHLASLDYYFLVNDLFAKEFGKENIALRVYEKSALYQNDLLLDFLKTTGFKSTTDFKLNVPNNNLSFDAHTLELFRKLKIQLSSDQETLEKIRDMLRAQNKRQAFQGNNVITAEQSSQVMARVAESNEKLAREYLGREDGVLFADQPGKLLSNHGVDVSDQEVSDFLMSIHLEPSEKSGIRPDQA